MKTENIACRSTLKEEVSLNALRRDVFVKQGRIALSPPRQLRQRACGAFSALGPPDNHLPDREPRTTYEGAFGPKTGFLYYHTCMYRYVGASQATRVLTTALGQTRPFAASSPSVKRNMSRPLLHGRTDVIRRSWQIYGQLDALRILYGVACLRVLPTHDHLELTVLRVPMVKTTVLECSNAFETLSGTRKPLAK